jgi:hypothetical protein
MACSEIGQHRHRSSYVLTRFKSEPGTPKKYSRNTRRTFNREQTY